MYPFTSEDNQQLSTFEDDLLISFFVFFLFSFDLWDLSAGQDEGLKLFAAGDEERQTVCRKKHAGNPVKGKIASLFKQNKNIYKG
jgi:hypothetical protein